jgi:hypothetical protein
VVYIHNGVLFSHKRNEITLLAGFWKSSSLNENLYRHFLYISERAKLTLIKSKQCSTNIIKYRKEKIINKIDKLLACLTKNKRRGIMLTKSGIKLEYCY